MTRIEYRCSVKKDHGQPACDVIALDRVLPDHDVPQGMTISFQRTIRLPENGKADHIPLDLGSFQLCKVQDFAKHLPPDMARKGGVFLQMHQREAMWVSFHANAPFLIKIYAGGVNAISGENSHEDSAVQGRRLELKRQGKSIQDYVVLPQQPWLDGFAVKPGMIRQFVARKIVQGFTVEAQLTGEESIGGLQFEITPAKHDPRNRFDPGRITRPTSVNRQSRIKFTVKTPPNPEVQFQCKLSASIYKVKRAIASHGASGAHAEDLRLIKAGRQLMNGATLWDENIEDGDTLYAIICQVRGGGGSRPIPQEQGHALRLTAGGFIEQDIREDHHRPDIWIKDLVYTIPVQILNSAEFCRVTGIDPPTCPIGRRICAYAGVPFYGLHKELPSEIPGPNSLTPSQSTTEIDKTQGLVAQQGDIFHRHTCTNVSQSSLGEGTRSDHEVFHVMDPHGLLSPSSQHREFRTLTDLEEGVRLAPKRHKRTHSGELKQS